MKRTVVVTGGGTGIGRAVAALFSAAGDSVVITGRRKEVLQKTASTIQGDVTVLTFDATDPDAVSRAAQQLGRVDVLVNNAGGNTDFDHPAPTDLAELAAAWRRNIDANLLSAVLVTHALLPAMAAGASIVSVGSIAADKGAGSYGAAKAGLASWNIDLARSIGDRGITANVVSPGFIASTEFFRDKLDPARRESLIDAAMTKRAGDPDDIAHAVVFLASSGASQITGQTVAVNGGEYATR